MFMAAFEKCAFLPERPTWGAASPSVHVSGRRNPSIPAVRPELGFLHKPVAPGMQLFIRLAVTRSRLN